MNSDRIKKLQEQTAFPDSVSVRQALLQVWNECQQENNIELAALRKENEELRECVKFFALLNEYAPEFQSIKGGIIKAMNLLKP